MTSRQPARRTIIQSFQAHVTADGPHGKDRTTAPGGVEEESELPTSGDIIGGCYRLLRKIGEGMFGQVYLAERTDVPEHRVALKVMIKKVYAGRNVERELVMLAAASHPHIVQLKDHGTSDKLVWLTMPLYQGETLEERLLRKPLTLREAHQIFVPIARGLQSLHQRGLRHQDVKPDNVFLADFGGQLHPMLLDLGVAVEKNATFVAGTALYCAPEQFAALSSMGRLAPLSEKLDSYGLASTLLHALVGDEHFPGEQASSPLMVANSFDERQRQPLRADALPELSGEPRTLLAEAFSRWLRKDPNERPSAGELADELDVLLEQEREATRAIEQSVARQKTSLQRVRLALGATALIVAGGVLYGYSKRETLRLAGELQHARAQGAASFDKLDTCAAAHRLSEQRVSACQLSRDDERSAHKRAIAGIATDKERALTSLSKRLTRNTARLRSCRDDAQGERDQHQREHDEWQTASQAQTRAFEAERLSFQQAASAQDKVALQCQSAKRDSEAQREQCRSELSQAEQAKDSCTTSLASVSDEASRCESDKARALTEKHSAISAKTSCELELLSCSAPAAKAPSPERKPAPSKAKSGQPKAAETPGPVEREAAAPAAPEQG